MKRYVSLALGALFASCISLAAAHAEVIYQDTFTGTDGDLLGARALPVATGNWGSTAGATWNAATTTNATITSTAADAAWTITGNTATIGSMSTGADVNLITNASVPFVPQTGVVYDLHLDVQPSTVGASGNWLGLAFTNANFNGHTMAGSASALSNDNPYGLIILKGTQVAQAFGGLGTANGVTLSNSSFNASSLVPVDITLDTTGANWVASWSINNTQVGTFTYTTNPTIGLIAFGTNKLTGTVDNFSVTANPVPEPASLSVLALGGAALLLRRRK